MLVVFRALSLITCNLEIYSKAGGLEAKPVLGVGVWNYSEFKKNVVLRKRPELPANLSVFVLLSKSIVDIC